MIQTNETLAPGVTIGMTPVFTANHAENQTLCGKFGRTRAAIRPVEPMPLKVDGHVKFLNDRRWWTVQATNPTHAVLTRGGDFGRGPVYTIIAWNEGRRGPHGSYGHAAFTRADCERIATDMASGTISFSERRAIYLDIAETRDPA